MDNQQEMARLREEINRLREQVLWYRRTYEDRSLLGLLYERLSRGRIRARGSLGRSWLRGGTGRRVRIRRAQAAPDLSGRVLCCVVNHNEGANAARLMQSLAPCFDTVLLDSGSDRPPRGSVRYGNLFYSGLLNEAFAIADRAGYRQLFFLCSDVRIEPADVPRLYERIRGLDFSTTGVYSPSARGTCHFFCRRQPGGGLRTVPFVEGFLFVADLDILRKFCPVDTGRNLYGWGLDIAKGYFARQLGRISVVDDDIEVEHPAGTGYSREMAEYEMLSWVRTFRDEDLAAYFNQQLALLNQQTNLT
ncbi:MAG TPA: hypothetical protein VG870_10125 [Chitinophagaceae bacterium]|nr:hypothetical protein [Chitinophagaceae bacterium]